MEKYIVVVEGYDNTVCNAWDTLEEAIKDAKGWRSIFQAEDIIVAKAIEWVEEGE